MNKNILLCTVGGSHEPILTSIRENKPDFVCFICSSKDGTTGSPGSDVQITGTGNVTRQRQSDKKPNLPNIPTQAELNEKHYEVIKVPTDDPDEAFKIISQRVQELAGKYPDASIIADYTGGTKSMSGALVLAAVENDAVDLELVTGARSTLEGIASGMETTEVISIETVRVERDINRFLGAWQYFAYGEAVTGFTGLKPKNSQLKKKVGVLRTLSKAFDAWDRFDHEQAEALIRPFSKLVAPTHKHLLVTLNNLTREGSRQTPARLWDLWFNALRRAEQARFDDAVARLYRLVEWTAQWLLKVHCKIDTADIQHDKIPPYMTLRQNRNDKYQAGLADAWRLVAHHLQNSEISQFGSTKLKTLQDQTKLRNFSILAHGYDPIGEAGWQKFLTWMEDNFLPLLETETKREGLEQIPQQLPQQPWTEIENL